MTIQIYPSRLEGEPLETHETTGSMSFLSWMQANVKGFSLEGRDHPITVEINGQRVEPCEWAGSLITPACDVRVYVEPRGVGAIVMAVVAIALAVVAMSMAKKAGKMSDSDQGKGKSLNDPGAMANTPRYGQAIPEIAGSPITFPDYIMPPHRYYTGPRVQWIDQLLCVGKGSYTTSAANVRIGDTPLPLLGDAAEVVFYGPGDVIQPEHAEWWHSPEEVGFTSFGGSGLTLTEEASVPSFWADQFVFSGDTIGSDTAVPEAWEAGMYVNVRAEHPISFGTNWIESSVLDTLPVAVGGIISIDADINDGEYEVLSIDEPAGEPKRYTVDAVLSAGQYVGSAGVNGFVYQIITVGAYQITVEPKGVSDWDGFPLDVISHQSYASLSSSSMSGGWVGPFVCAPENEIADKIEVDIFLPQGLIHYNKKGKRKAIMASGVIQWRPVGEQDWESLPFSHKNATEDQMGFTYAINPPEPGRFEVRVRRNPKLNWSSTSEELQWTGLRSRIVGAPEKYEGMTVMHVRLRSGDKVSGNTENKISLRARRILPTVADPDVMEPTRDIVPFFIYMMGSVGYGRNLLDMDALEDLHKTWSSRQDTFDVAIGQRSTLKTVANQCLGAGWGELTLRRGKISAVRDALTSWTPTRVFSPQEYTSPLVESSSAVMPDDIDGVDVEYVDYATGRTVTEEYRLEGDLGVRVEKIKASGVTNRTMAWRHAARRRREAAYRRTTWSGSTELHAMNCYYLDFVGLQDGIPEFGQSAFVLKRDGDKVWLSEPIESPVGKVIIFRKADGTAGKSTLILAENSGALTLQDVPDYVGFDTVAYIGNKNKVTHLALITEVTPSKDNRVGFKAKIMDPRIYADDDSGPNRRVLTSLVYAEKELTSLVYDDRELTSPPYVVEIDEAMKSVRVDGLGVQLGWPFASSTEAMKSGEVGDVDVLLRSAYKKTEHLEQMRGVGVSDVDVLLRALRHEYNLEPEQMKGVGVSDVDVLMEQRLITYVVEPHEMQCVGISDVDVYNSGTPIVEAPYNIQGEWIEDTP